MVGPARLGLAPARGGRASALLEPAGARLLVRAAVRSARAARSLASGRARGLVRGGGVLPLGGAAAAHRGGMGDGGHPRSPDRTQASLPLARGAAAARAREPRLPVGFAVR